MSVHIEPLISFIAAPRVLGSMKATTIVTRGAPEVAPSQQGARDVIFGIRPDDIAPADAATAVGARQHGKVVVTEPMGAETYFVVDCGGHEFVAKALGRQVIQPGADIELVFGVGDIKLFDPKSQLTLT